MKILFLFGLSSVRPASRTAEGNRAISPLKILKTPRTFSVVR